MGVTRFDYTGFNPLLGNGLDHFNLISSREQFVGLAIAPVLEVQQQTGEFKYRAVRDILKNYDTQRHNEGTYSRGTFRFSKDNYVTQEHGFEVPIDEREAAIHRGWWDAEMEAAELARDQVLRNHNQRVITAALAGTSLTAAAGTVWTNIGSSDPVADVRAGRIAMKGAGGVLPNSLVVNWRVYETLRDCDAIRDRLVNLGLVDRTVAQPMISNAMLAAALDLQNVFVSGGQVNADEDPTAPTTLADQWTNTKALLFARDDGPSLQRPQYMRTFHWGGDGSQIGAAYETYYNDERRANIFRQRMDTQEKVLVGAAAYIITSVA